MQNFESKASPILPWEVIDRILILANDGFLAAHLDRIFALKHITGKKPDAFWAVENGKEKLLQFLKENGDIRMKLQYEKSFQMAAMLNYYITIKFWQDNIQHLKRYDLVPSAALGGHLPLVKYLESIGCKTTNIAMDSAASNGHLNIVSYLHSQGISPTENTFNLAAENGHLHVIQSLYALGYTATPQAINNASKYGFTHIVQYLHSQGTCPTPEALELAALNGHIDTVKYLYSIGCKAGPDTLDYAARRGHLEIVKFLHDKGCKYRKDTLDRVAFAGHLEMLKYLESIGCEFTNLGEKVKSSVGPLVAFMGKQKVFKYLYCKANMDQSQRDIVLFHAQTKGHKDLVKWIQKQ